MNKTKKILVAACCALGIGCLGAAAGCSEPEYYKLVFEGKGVNFIMQGDLDGFESGGTVRKGVEVRFGVSLGSNATGTPVINLNGNNLSPNGDGVYSFVMDGESVVSATGFNVMSTVNFDKMQPVRDDAGNVTYTEVRVKYLGEDGKELSSVKVKEGDSVKFKLDVSPYYVREKENAEGAKVRAYTVICNTEELEPDSNGYYTAQISGDANISVSGLEQEEAFYERMDGTGTAEDPYMLRRPIDVYYVAALCNNDYFSARFYNAHYKLANDIDMEGEQMFVIGDGSNEQAIFSGNFDGNGKTISNFYITDEVIDQSDYTQAYLGNVGMFGYVVATLDKPAVIKNLNLENYEVRVHTAKSKAPAYAGGIVGFGVGAQITGCHTSGKMIAVGDDNQMVYLGGIAGLLQSIYRDDLEQEVRHDAYVQACSTDVAIDGTGSPRSAGGIVGYLVSYDSNAIAYVTNCYATGDVSGAMHSGGICGTLGRYSSVTNCYATGAVIANNGVNSALVNENFKGAYAGGIVGYAENDTVVAYCYAQNGGVSASSINGAKYQTCGDIIGLCAPANDGSVNGQVAVEHRCLKKGANDTVNDLKTKLGWVDSEWNLDSLTPAIIASDDERAVKIKVYNGNTPVNEYEKTVSDDRPCIYEWYKDKNLPEVVGSGDSLSWGYYFDEARTKKVPRGFVPVAAEELLYFGYANYADVAGRYYLESTDYSSGAYVELTVEEVDGAPKGVYLFRNGGMTYSGVYKYDGENIILEDTCLAALKYSAEQLNGAYFTVLAKVDGGKMSISGVASLVDLENSTADNPTYLSESFTLSAVSAVSDFGYGEYLGANGGTYKFGKDGYGSFVNANGRTQGYTYSVDKANNKVTLNLTGGGVWKGALAADGKITTVNGVSVQKLDGFAGVWQKSAASDYKFEFDGQGQVTVYGDTTEKVPYAAAGEGVTFTANSHLYEASFNSDGYLTIDGESYYPADGYTGVWYMSGEKERVEITLEGRNAEGYGYASLSYTGSAVGDFNGQYDVYEDAQGAHVRIYVNDLQYADLVLDEESGQAKGALFSLNEFNTRRVITYVNATTYLFDSFKGVWVTGAYDMDSITFNGRSASGKAEAVVKATDGSTQRGKYTVNEQGVAELTLGNKVYELTFNEKENKVDIKLRDDAASGTLTRRDRMYGVVLYDNADPNVSYEFNGKGYVDGKVKVTGGSELSYVIGTDGSVTIDGKSLVQTVNGFTYDGKNLVFKTGFEGEWLISGTLKSMQITEIDGYFRATVTYPDRDGAFEFTYDPASGSLTNTETEKGERVKTVLKLAGGKELSISRNSVSGEKYYNCVSQADQAMGTYTAGDGSSWTLDGLGLGVYGSGTAVYTKRGGTPESYSYKIDKLGNPYIRYEGGVVLVTDDSSDGFVKDGHSYKLVHTDALYMTVATSSDVKYVFDGVSRLYKEQGGSYVEAYTYKINSITEVELTDSEGKVFKGELKKEGAITTLTVTAKD